MRQLTKPEIDAAPGWATHYVIMRDGKVSYIRDLIGQWGDDAQPIPRKEFDIVTYDFICGDIDYAVRSTSNNVVMVMTEPVDCLRIEKQDAIALAKHFKLTASDLS